MLAAARTADSLSFVLDDAVLTADTVLGCGTCVIDKEDGLQPTTWNRCAGCVAWAGGPCCQDTGRTCSTWKRICIRIPAASFERLEQIRAALQISVNITGRRTSTRR